MYIAIQYLNSVTIYDELKVFKCQYLHKLLAFFKIILLKYAFNKYFIEISIK